jgi:hypothetical protein
MELRDAVQGEVRGAAVATTAEAGVGDLLRCGEGGEEEVQEEAEMHRNGDGDVPWR